MAVLKTALGLQVVKDRSIALSSKQRSALILFDGKRSVAEVMQMTAGLGVKEADVQALFHFGLLQDVADRPPAVRSLLASSPDDLALPLPSVAEPDTDLRLALDAALTASSDLGFKGFGLSMALAGVERLEQLQKLAPELRKAMGDDAYKSLHELIFKRPV